MAALAAGLILALAPPMGSGSGELAARGPPRWVVADRDARELVWLDGDLLVVRRLAVPWPERVRAHPAGGAWVVTAPLGYPGQGHELRWLDPLGGIRAVHAVPPARDLEVDAQGRAWLLAGPAGGGAEVWGVSGRSPAVRHAVPDDAQALAVGPTGVGLAVASQGLLLLVEEQACWSTLWQPSRGQVLDLAPSGGGWRILLQEAGRGSERVLELRASGEVVGSVPCPDAARFADGSAPPSVCWIVGRGGGWVRRIDRGRDGRRPFARPPAVGARVAALDHDGGLVLATGGALLRLGADGAAAPGQGGFEHLTDLDRLGPP